MPSNDETHEYIVVNDALPRLSDRDNISESASLTNSHAADHGSSGPRRRSGRPLDALERLRAVPAVREIPWYEGKELPPDKSTESTRVQTRDACLLAARGEVQHPPCTDCATGVGRFSQCIASDDWFSGACATCQLATRGHLCSLRKQETLGIMPEDRSKHHNNDTLRVTPRQTTSSQVEPRIEPKAPSQNRGVSKAQLPDIALKKRKHETLQKTPAWAPYTSPYLPTGSHQRFEPGIPSSYSSPNTIYPLGPVYSNDAYPVNYIYQRDNSQTLTKLPVLLPTPNQSELQNDNSDLKSTLQQTIEPTEIASNSRPHQPDTENHQNAITVRDQSDSLSPSTQLLHTFYPADEEKSHRRGSIAINVDSKPATPLETPLIDTLPRKKQKQIFSIIGGLQSGIRICKQQAESMQKQLDLLQTALGLDSDEDNGIPVVD